MIPVDDGKFFVNGSEITLDYRADIPSHLLKHLEECTMTQLDAFYIRKRIYQLSTCIESSTDLIKKRIGEIEKEFAEFQKLELDCQASIIPRIVSEEMHKIVNGKFDTIDKSLAKSNEDNKVILEQIRLVLDKTIYGAIKKSFEKRPIRTMITTGIIGVFTFVYIMLTLHIDSINDLFYKFLKWFPF